MYENGATNFCIKIIFDNFLYFKFLY
jgi:hypothetical protein